MKRGTTSGLVLITALVMLLILTLLGISGSQMMVLHLRMAGNLHQMHQAFQAAEAALRDGEHHIANHIDQHSVFSPTCEHGLCATSTLDATPWNTAPVDWQTGKNTIVYGSTTGTPALPGNNRQPRYIIERLPTPNTEPLDDSAPIHHWYRVTAVSYTAHGSIQHILQSTYRR